MPIRETEEKLRKLASVGGKNADLGWLLFLSGEAEERQSADELLDVLLFQKLQKDYREKIFLDPAPAADCVGEYSLGTVVYPPGKPFCPFGLRENEWIKHVLIAGMTGTGKTNLAFQVLRELRKKNKPFMVFDWKRNYRDLLQLPELRDTLVFTVGRDVVPFRFNPLIPPPATLPGEWLMKLVDVIKHAYFVGEGVEYLLREAIDWAYEKSGFLDGSRAETPTFYKVRDYVYKKHTDGRMSLWKASALRVLESLCFRHGLGPVVNSAELWDYKTLLDSPVILELDALSDSDKIFLTEAMILWLYEFRKNEGKREEFKHALVIEEGHHILSYLKESVEGSETIMETSLRQIREFGESVIVIDQEPTKLSNSIKANTYTKIVFNLGNGKDILDVSNCLSLTKEESEFIDWLDVGHAILSLKGRVNVPLHVAFPRVDIRKGFVRDEQIAGHITQ
ncbi:MAG: ATP-binding protein [Acidobacteria bacterium]|nr:ATP-binding protein [Acidobacteriota bacterium]